jgi:hypothetical protein
MDSLLSHLLSLTLFTSRPAITLATADGVINGVIDRIIVAKAGQISRMEREPKT